MSRVAYQYYRAVLAEKQEVIITSEEYGFASVSGPEVVCQFLASSDIVLELEACLDGLVISLPNIVGRSGGVPASGCKCYERTPRKVTFIREAEPKAFPV